MSEMKLACGHTKIVRHLMPFLPVKAVYMRPQKVMVLECYVTLVVLSAASVFCCIDFVFRSRGILALLLGLSNVRMKATVT